MKLDSGDGKPHWCSQGKEAEYLFTFNWNFFSSLHQLYSGKSSLE